MNKEYINIYTYMKQINQIGSHSIRWAKVLIILQLEQEFSHSS